MGARSVASERSAPVWNGFVVTPSKTSGSPIAPKLQRYAFCISREVLRIDA